MNKIYLKIFAAFALMFPAPAKAAYSDVGEMADSVTETFGSLGQLAAMGFFFAGFGLAGWGIWLLAQGARHGHGEGKGKAILCIVCGVLLMSITAFSDTLSGTLTGGSAQGIEELGLN